MWESASGPTEAGTTNAKGGRGQKAETGTRRSTWSSKRKAIRARRRCKRQGLASESTIWICPCYGQLNMAATVEISVPDTLMKAIGAKPAELPRQTLEALIVQA